LIETEEYQTIEVFFRLLDVFWFFAFNDRWCKQHKDPKNEIIQYHFSEDILVFGKLSTYRLDDEDHLDGKELSRKYNNLDFKNRNKRDRNMKFI
jgi:hypothetical protein